MKKSKLLKRLEKEREETIMNMARVTTYEAAEFYNNKKMFLDQLITEERMRNL